MTDMTKCHKCLHAAHEHGIFYKPLKFGQSKLDKDCVQPTEQDNINLDTYEQRSINILINTYTDEKDREDKEGWGFEFKGKENLDDKKTAHRTFVESVNRVK
jgi:hypothetical protein